MPKVNAKAIKDFQTRFADANNAMWFSDAKTLGCPTLLKTVTATEFL
jgi:hypothetical protein